MPYTGINIMDASYTANDDFRSSQYVFVKFQAANVVQMCSGGTAIACGIIQNNPNSGQEAVVRHVGMSKLCFASSVTAGQIVNPGAYAKGKRCVIGTDTTEYAVCEAVETASSGDIRSVIIRGTPFRGA